MGGGVRKKGERREGKEGGIVPSLLPGVGEEIAPTTHPRHHDAMPSPPA